MWGYVTLVALATALARTPLEPLKALLGSILMLLLPFNVGLLLLPFNDRLKKQLRSYLALSLFLWLSGFTILVLAAALLSLPGGPYRIDELLYVAVALSILPLVSSKTEKVVKGIRDELRGLGYKRLIAAAIGALIPLFIFMYHTPFPLTISLDELLFHRLSLELSHGAEHSSLYTLPYANYFGFYSFTALLSRLCGCLPLSLYWMAPTIVYPTYAFAIFVLAYYVSRSKVMALLSSLFAPWFQGWVTGSAPYLFLPRTILMVIYPLILAVMLEIESKERPCLKRSALRLFASLLPLPLYLFTRWLSRTTGLVYPAWLSLTYPVLLAIFYLGGLRRGDPLTLFLALSSLTAFSFHGADSLIYSLALTLPLLMSLISSTNPGYGVTLTYFTSLLCFLHFIAKWPSWSYLTQAYIRANPVLSFLDRILNLPALLPSALGGKALVDEAAAFSYNLNRLFITFTPLGAVLFPVGLVESLRRLNEPREAALSFASLGLIYTYFLPFFFSSRIIEYLTPFVSFYLARVIALCFNYVNSFLSRFCGTKVWRSPLTLLLVAALTLTFMTYLPMNYQAFLSYLREEGFRHDNYVSVISYEDLRALEVMNVRGKALVVSDLLTARLLRDLSGGGLFYRVDPKVLCSYSYERVKKLANGRPTFIVVNERTFKWLSGDPSKPFIGFRMLLSANNTLERVVLGSDYYIFKVKVGVRPKVVKGPELTILTESGLKRVSAVVRYYEPFHASCYLRLNGSLSYRIIGYPGNWVLEEVRVNGKSVALPRERDEYIELSGLKPKDRVELIWRANLLYNETGYKESDFVGWTFLGSKRPYWSQMENVNLNIDLERYPVMILSVKGSANAVFRLYLFLSDGKVVDVFRGHIKAPIAPAEMAIDFSSISKGRRVVGIVFRSTSVDGKPYAFKVNYIIFARR